MAGEDRTDGEELTAENVCESCDQKDLCPVYMGQGCLLVQERST